MICANNAKNAYSLFFHFLLAVHFIVTILSDSLFPITQGMVQIIRILLACSLLVVIFLRNENLGLRYIMISLFLGVISVGAVYWSGKELLLITMLFVIGAKGENFTDICKTYFVSASLTVAGVILLCLSGGLEDTIFPHGAEVAHSLGFSYYSTPAFLFLIIQVTWMYLRHEKITWFELIVFLAADYFLNKVFTVRLTFLLGVFSVVLCIMIIKMRLVNPSSKWIQAFSKIAYSALLVVIIWISFAYDLNHPVWNKWNSRLNNRLMMLNEAYHRYSIGLSGNRIEMLGQNSMINGEALSRDYFYIDSGMGFSIFAYGLLFTVVVVVIYTFLYISSCKYRDYSLFIWLSTILLFTFMNNIWLDLAYNPVLLALIPALEKQGILRKAV